jgi:hypothetical protein
MAQRLTERNNIRAASQVVGLPIRAYLNILRERVLVIEEVRFWHSSDIRNSFSAPHQAATGWLTAWLASGKY